MMNTNLRWFSLEREFLPAALFGNSKDIDYTRVLTFGRPLPDANRVALGYTIGSKDESYNPPSLIVIQENAAPDFLSWLRTFSPVTSPLTQFARVVTDKDWERLSAIPVGKAYLQVQREDRWACLLLGEALSQADNETLIQNLPISVASSCFSSAVARTAILYGTDAATKICIDRLQELQADRRFAQRPMSVEDLIPAWNIMTSIIDKELSATEAAMLIVDAAIKSSRINLTASETGFKFPRLKDFHGLFSDSIEERVMAHQRLLNELMHLSGPTTHDARTNALVAASAYLVGRGTSHSFLIRRSIKKYPSAYVWYGLIAAAAGPLTWDANWARTAKGMERMLRSKFDWTDSTSVDLCWIEYSWFAKIYEGLDIFYDIPKLFPRGLSIEIVPGASCQLRFSDQRGSVVEPEHRYSAGPNLREQELESTLAQFLTLAAKARQLIGGAQQVSSPAPLSSLPLQAHLDLEGTKKTVKRIVRTSRRTKPDKD